MDINSHPSKIKPILSHSLLIENLYHYQDFHRRRYKKTINFKFQCPENPIYTPNGFKSQTQLFTALKTIKVLKKTNLSQAKIIDYSASQSKTFSIYKKISKVPILSMQAYCRPGQVYRGKSVENWPKIFRRVHNLTYELTGMVNGHRTFTEQPSFKNSEIKKIISLQRNLRFCPKLQGLVLKFPQYPMFPSMTFHNFERYPRKLKHLHIQPACDNRMTNSSLGYLKSLEAISLTFSSTFSHNFIKNTMNTLSGLQSLKEIDLKFKDSQNFDIYSPAFDKIATQTLLLRKLRLKFDERASLPPKILESLTKFHQLSSFTLSVKCSSILPFISEALANMTQLQYLHLTLFHIDIPLKTTDDLEDLSKKISQLEKLEHLELSLNLPALSYEKINQSTFFLHLNHLFQKPIKIKTFRFTCQQINPQSICLTLFKMLENSRDSLQNLKIDLRSYKPEEHNHTTILSFFKGLSNIRVLELPSFEIPNREFLNDLAETVQTLKYLRIFTVGMMRDTVTSSGFSSAVKSILEKKGLRVFTYKIDKDLMETLRATGNKKLKIDFQEVIKRNPYIEMTPQNPLLFNNPASNNDW